MNELTTVNQPNYLEIVDRLNVSDNTRETYGYAVKGYLAYCRKHTTPHGIASMTAWLHTIENAETMSIALAAVKRVLGEVFKHDPRLHDLREELSRIKPSRRDKNIRESDYLTKSEVDRLAAGMPEGLACMALVMFWTGLRVSETLNIEIKNCRAVKSVVEIRVIGKRNKETTVFITDRLFKRCQKAFPFGDFLFHHKGKKYNRKYVGLQFAGYGKSILGKRVHPHIFRHSKAMYLKDVMKLSVDQVQKALNHASATTTIEHYFHGRPDAAAQGIK